MPTILIAEDDAATRRAVARALKHEHFNVLETEDADSIVQLVADEAPDLVILDVRLRRGNGFDVCRRLRASGCQLPIIFLTGRTAERDRLCGLKMAEDYLIKPFSLRELQARVHNQLRPSIPAIASSQASFGEIEIDFGTRMATRNGQALNLTHREFDILRYFLERKSELVTRGDLLHAVWKLDAQTATRTVDVHILKLRRKIETDPDRPQFLRSIWGEGYTFIK
jgi:DNA-binding response OmpR family regulator